MRFVARYVCVFVHIRRDIYASIHVNRIPHYNDLSHFVENISARFQPSPTRVYQHNSTVVGAGLSFHSPGIQIDSVPSPTKFWTNKCGPKHDTPPQVLHKNQTSTAFGNMFVVENVKDS